MRYGVVAAGHRLTAQAGSDILEAGGNAFDAAVAAALASCVVEPSLTSLGGGGFLLRLACSSRFPVSAEALAQGPVGDPDTAARIAARRRLCLNR